MIPILIIAVVLTLILLLWIKLKNKRVVIAIIIGFVAGVLSFFAFILLELFFSAQNSILGPLILAFYISLIAFLVLWNIIKTKKVYLLLLVPVICVLTDTISN